MKVKNQKGLKMPTSAGEEATRKWFENRYGKTFPKARPEFLRYKRKACLELDGYCEELKIAFEYNGKQHYEPSAYFKQDEKSFQYLVESDRWKYRKCIDQGIFLVVVPNVEAKMVDEWLNQYFSLVAKPSIYESKAGRSDRCIAMHCTII